MRFFVLTPLAAFLLLMLLVLMVQLAGLRSPTVNQPLAFSDAPFELENIHFEPSKVAQEQEAPAPTAVMEADYPEPAPSLDALLSPPQLFEPEPHALESEPLDVLAPQIELDLSLLDDVLDNIAITVPKPVKKQRESPKKVIKKAVVKTAHKERTDRRSQKAVKRTSRTSQSVSAAHAQSSVSRASAASAKGKVKSSPVAVSKVKPKYPSRARRRGIEGEVVVAFQVQANGRVKRNSIRVVSAKPQKTFDKAVISAVSRWRFAPSAGGYQSTQKLVFSLKK